MTALAPTLQRFFTERLITQRHASAHTIGAYRDTGRPLLRPQRHPAAAKAFDATYGTKFPKATASFPAVPH